MRDKLAVNKRKFEGAKIVELDAASYVCYHVTNVRYNLVGSHIPEILMRDMRNKGSKLRTSP